MEANFPYASRFIRLRAIAGLRPSKVPLWDLFQAFLQPMGGALIHVGSAPDGLLWQFSTAITG
jgi:hypothetical protein